MANKRSDGAKHIYRSSKITDRLDLGLNSAAALGMAEKLSETRPNRNTKPEKQGNGQRRVQDKLELGISILQHVEGQLNRADSKAQFTLTLDALLIASSAFLGTGAKGEVVGLSATTFSSLIVPVLGIAMFVTLLISTIYALLAVIPRFTPKTMANNNIFYFGNIAQQKRDDFAEHYISQSYREIEKMLMSEIHDLSGIAKQKFSLIRISYIFLFLALGFWSILQMVILLTR